MESTRKFGIKTKSTVTKFFSRKMNRLVMCESSLEAKFCYFLEFNDDVVSYKEQPFTINCDGTLYTPDFLVSYFNGDEIIYEIKHSKILSREKQKFY